MVSPVSTPIPIPPPQPQTVVLSDGRQLFKATALSGTGSTAVFTAQAAAQRVISRVDKLVIVNDTAGAINITVTLTIAATDYTYYSVTSLAARGRLEFPATAESMAIILADGDALKVTGNTDVDVFVSVTEFVSNIK